MIKRIVIELHKWVLKLQKWVLKHDYVENTQRNVKEYAQQPRGGKLLGYLETKPFKNLPFFINWFYK